MITGWYSEKKLVVLQVTESIIYQAGSFKKKIYLKHNVFRKYSNYEIAFWALYIFKHMDSWCKNMFFLQGLDCN